MGCHLKFIPYFFCTFVCILFKYLTVLIELVRKWEHGQKLVSACTFSFFLIQSCENETGVNTVYFSAQSATSFFKVENTVFNAKFLKQRCPQECILNSQQIFNEKICYSASAGKYLPLVFIPTLRRTYFFNSALSQEHIFSNSATISSSPLRVTNRTPDSGASEYDSQPIITCAEY